MESQKIEKLIERIDKYAKSHVSESRYQHSVRVAETAEKMCRIYGLEPRLGFLAGISHDICKSTDDEKMIELAKKDGKPFLDIEKEKPALLHGRAAAVLLREKFEIDDEDLIEAVANHTFGMKGMSDLGKILFIADKVEPGREHVTEEYLKSLFSLDLSLALKRVLFESFEYLKSKGKSPAKESLDLYESL